MAKDKKKEEAPKDDVSIAIEPLVEKKPTHAPARAHAREDSIPCENTSGCKGKASVRMSGGYRFVDCKVCKKVMGKPLK